MARAKTVADLARHLNVSPGTVSKALNNRHDVSAETRLRVLEAARRLDYPLKNAAGKYESGRTQVRRVALLSFGTRREQLFGDYVYGKLIHAIEEEIARGGEELILEFGLSGVPRSFRSGGLDGAIVLGSREAPQTVRAMKGVHVVCAPNAVEYAGVNCICQDAHRGGETLTKLLIDRGHRHIAFVARDCRRRAFVEMGSGYALAMRQAELEASYITREDYGAEVEEDLARRAVESGATAVLAGNDNLAVELMKIWAGDGLEVPDDLSVVGFENYPQSETLAGLPLTTMDGNLDEIGKLAVRLLRERFVDGKQPPVRVVVPPTLVEGQSVAAPRGRANV